ncbi:MAG: trigger factor [Chloroflexi bacterium]|nr:trigger factor [Chloroflexota bacterium]
MKVTQGETKDRQTTLHIEVDDDLLEQHLGRAYKRVAARVNVPGFRKGKAPRSVVERFVGKEYLLEEAIESLVPAAVGVAVKQEGLEASATPRVSVVEREPVVKIDATVPLPPQGTLGEYASIRFDDEVEKITDEQVEESVQRLVEANASWEEVDRAVKAGDLITFSVTGTVDGEIFMDQEDSEYLADADNPNPVPGFSAALAGIEPGGNKSFSIDVPADFAREALAGKKTEFTVSVAKIQEKNLPELSDELVKGLGEGITTVADLRSRIRENLEARADQALRETLEEKVVNELVERSTFELAPLMIEHEAEHILYDQQSALARYNISIEQYLARTGQSSEELVAGAKKTAESRVKRTLVMDLLAESEGLEPASDEVAEEIEAWRARSETGPNAGSHAHSAHLDGGSETDYDSEDTRKAVVSVLKRRKAVERALEIAKSKANGAMQTTKAKAVPAKAGQPGEEVDAQADSAGPEVVEDVAETTETVDTASK